MQRELKYIDISNVPELLRIAEEVRITNQPRILRRDSEDVAVLMPVTPSLKRRAKREITKSDYEAFLSAAGSWKGLVDPDKLIADIYESRRISSKPAFASSYEASLYSPLIGQSCNDSDTFVVIYVVEAY